MRKKDKTSSILFFFIGIGFIVGGIKMGLGPLNSPGAGFFPAAIGGIFSILSLSLLITASRGKSREEQSEPFWKGEKSWVKVSLALLALVFYMFFLEYLGYILTTVLFTFFLLKYVGRKGWVVSIITAVLVSLGSYALFKIALGVPLPRGLIAW
jgi:putative tricarboxylic transport membrane protein